MAKDHPWHRQSGESEQAFAAFEHWLNNKYTTGNSKTPARSCTAMSKAVGLSVVLLQGFSREWGWIDRGLAYDNHFQRIKTKTAEQELAKMHRRHLKLSKSMQKFGGSFLETTIPDEDNCTPGQAVAAIEAGVKIERLTRGEVTDRTAAQDELDLSKLNDEELAQLSALREKARR